MDRASKQRLWLMLGLFILSLILYIDRVCISTGKADIAKDLQLNDVQMGWVFAMFTLGYALFQVPSGLLVDRYGPRLVLSAIVIIWSIFTGLTGLVTGLVTLLVVRFIFGAGEAGAFPGAARVFYNWLPVDKRGFANGIMFSGSRLGGAVAFLALPGLIHAIGWRETFFLMGAIGILWAVLWYIFFRDHPEQNAQAVKIAAQQPATAADYKKVFAQPAVWLTMAQYFASNFTFFICLSWMLPYLQKQFNLSPVDAGFYAMIPLLCATASQWASGYLVDVMYRSSAWRAWSRRLPAALGFAMGVVGLCLIPLMDTPLSVVICFTIAVFGADMTISPSWTHCVDIGGKGSGAISGSMNMVGNLGSFLSSIAFPYLLLWTGTSSSYFLLAAFLNVIGVWCWLSMKAPPAVTDNTK
jgi:MFS transporter, ACS family, glucarate transporter